MEDHDLADGQSTRHQHRARQHHLVLGSRHRRPRRGRGRRRGGLRASSARSGERHQHDHTHEHGSTNGVRHRMHPTGGPNPAGSPASRWLPVRCAGEPPPVLRQRSRLVRGLVRRAHACPIAGLGGHRRRRPHPDPGPDRFGQDPGRVPLGDRPSGERAAARPQGAHPRPLRLAAARPGRRRGEEPPSPAGRHPARRRADGRAARPRPAGGRPHRRHPGPRPAAPGDPPARHPHHHAGVALPDAHVTGSRDPAQRPVGDHRRDPRPGGHQARRAPRAVARTVGRAHRAAGPTHRPVRHAASAR